MTMLGINFTTNELVVGKADDGMFAKAWPIRRVPETPRDGARAQASPSTCLGPEGGGAGRTPGVVEECPPTDGSGPRPGATLSILVSRREISLKIFGYTTLVGRCVAQRTPEERSRPTTHTLPGPLGDGAHEDRRWPSAHERGREASGEEGNRSSGIRGASVGTTDACL